jgi:hypothetical protein
VLLAGDARSGQSDLGANACAVSLTQVVRIPVKVSSSPESAEPTSGDMTLTVFPGDKDELPQGPSGFDVGDDGGFLITDPLRERILVVDPQGKFRNVWKIGFAADSLTALPDGLVLVREAKTGQLHTFDREGQSRPTAKVVVPQLGGAQVLTGKSGNVARPGGNAERGSITIQFEKPGLTLLSLESLATDGQGNTYVALESTSAGASVEAINLNKYVRKYTADGTLIREIADIPLDYYVPPVDELRVHGGMVYQLMTRKSEVDINVWNTNQGCSAPAH